MSTAPSPTGYAHIVHPADGGEPSIDGLRIRVRDVVSARDDDGLTPKQIVTDVYPFLTLAQVYAALTYYEDHRDEIAAFERRNAEFVEEFKKQHPESVIDRRGSRE